MNKYHQEILRAIKTEAKISPSHQPHNPQKYEGHNDFVYPLNNLSMKKIAQKWIREHHKLSLKELIDLLNSLYQGKSSNEKSMAGVLLRYLPKIRKQIPPQLIDEWLNHLRGWCQVDSLCQSNFSANDLLLNWSQWKNLLIKLSKDDNINKRRASLVLLVRPVRNSQDSRFTEVAFQNIDRLKTENNILITKAVSWLLREMIKKHRSLVKEYLEKNLNQLPKVAVRETKNKLLTGRK